MHESRIYLAELRRATMTAVSGTESEPRS